MSNYLKPDDCYLENGKSICKVIGCGKKHYSKGFCKTHYYSQKKQQAQHKKAQEKYEELHTLERQERNREYYIGKKKEVLTEEGYEGILSVIKTLDSYKLDLLRDFLLGKAEIVHKDDLRAVETVRKWIFRMGGSITKQCEDMLKNPKVSDKVKQDIIKEILGRIIPPKHEIAIDNKREKMTVEELVQDGLRIVSIIEKAEKPEIMVRRDPGRPNKGD